MTAPCVLHVAKVSGISGSERHLLSLLPGLAERGFEIRIAMLHENEPGSRLFAARAEEAGIPVEPIRLRGPADPAAFARLVRAARRLRPSLLHTHLVHADFYGLAAGAVARVPVLASTKHGFNAFRARRLFALADRSVARLARLHIAISAGLARYLAETEGFDERGFEIVHYGLEAGPEPEPYEGPPGRILCVGRLIPVKGHDVLLEAFARARAAEPGLELVLAGSGPLESRLRDRAQELALDGAVTFAGHVSPIEPAMAGAAAVVVPSLGEGFGMVALEAMERGRAVVASAVGGLPEIVVEGETGLLVPTADVQALADALVAVGRDPSLARRLGESGRRRALAEFSQERCTARTEELYRAALDGVRAGS